MTRSALTLAAVLAFAVAAFGARTLAQVRRHGDSGWRFGRPGRPAEAVAQVLGAAGLVLLLVAPAAALVAGAPHRPGGVAALAAGDGAWRPAAAAAGGVLVVVGMALTLVAQAQMGASWRIGVDTAERTDLVTGGLFRSVRNPIFTGMLAFGLGEVLLVPNAVALAGAAIGLAGLEAQVRAVEEPYLVATHGHAYGRWAASTGRFLPRLGRLRGS